MRFGLFIMGTARGSYQAVLEQICEAEELGFDTALLAERHFEHGDLLFPAPFSFGAAVAARTQRIRIATAARILPLAHPIHVAEDAATLDILSNGRLEFGVTRASLDERCHDAFHSPMEQSRRRFEESLDVIVRAWTSASFSYEGQHYRIPTVSVSPRPLQKPHPPIYVVAVSPQTVAFAGRRGHCVYLPATRTVGELQETAREYWHHRHGAGYDGSPGALSINRFVYVADDERRARREIEAAFMGFIDRRAPDLKAALRRRYGERPLDYDQLIEDFCIFGSPRVVAERLHELQTKLGTTYVLCSLNFITLDHERCLRSMRLLASEVIPQLREPAAEAVR
jgi:alkanesulfonate monooxygenase SsuD/methylene tetrahydromethanopterin reductase-like flavin-dependent oxidoreductase (luciferase family)